MTDGRLVGVRVHGDKICIGVEWDEGYCEQPLTLSEARMFRLELLEALAMAEAAEMSK